MEFGVELCRFFTLPLTGRVGAGLPATGWGEEPGGTLDAFPPGVPPTPSPSPPGGGGLVGACRNGGVMMGKSNTSVHVHLSQGERSGRHAQHVGPGEGVVRFVEVPTPHPLAPLTRGSRPLHVMAEPCFAWTGEVKVGS